jgi:hypothetical protein
MAAATTVIVVPVFNDGPSLSVLLDRLSQTLGRCAATTSILVIDDGSLPPLEAEPIDPKGLGGSIVSLKRNVGHQRAIAIGLAYAVTHRLGETVVVMDADGEDRPDDVPRLMALAADAGPMAVVVGERAKRSEGFLFRAFYQLYRLLFLILTGKSIRFGNFSAMPVAAARRLADMSELWFSFPGAILRSRIPITKLPTERGRRFHGSSRMNLVSLVVHGLSAVAVFIEHALTRIILFALALVFAFSLASVVAIAFKFIGWSTPGWLTTVVGLSLVLLLNTAILCYVTLSQSIVGAAHSLPPPSAAYSAYIAAVTPLGRRSGAE